MLFSQCLSAPGRPPDEDGAYDFSMVIGFTGFGARSSNREQGGQGVHEGEGKKAGLKEKVIQEMTEMLLFFLYLALFFCSVTTYRMLVLHELGISYFHYGFALVKALFWQKSFGWAGMCDLSGSLMIDR